MREFGMKVRARRNELGLSQKDLAQRLGYINHSSVAKVEAGKVDLPVSKVQEFAEALGVSVKYLMGIDSHADELAEVYDPFVQHLEMMKDKTTAELYREFLDLNLSPEELKALYKYAVFLVSQR